MNENQKPVAVYTDMDDTDFQSGVRLLEDAGFEVRYLGTRNTERIIAASQDAEVLLLGYAEAPRSLIEALPKLKLIALMSMGFNNVDIEAANEHGVWVTNVPGAATEEVATHALALLLAAVRQLSFYTAHAVADAEQWNARAPLAPVRLSEKTLGVVGLGRIGKAFAAIAGPLFQRVVGYDPYLPDTDETRAELARYGIERKSLADLQSGADVLSLHVPLTDENEGMINRAFIAELPDGAIIVNVSRGGLIDSQDARDALDAGKLAALALDVLDEEPPAADHPLLSHDRVVLTPHIAYYSNRTDAEYVRIQAENATSWLATGRPKNPVNTP
ncbi:C-terminal binding protein [Canibacter zhoujuaniae]|uniref:C-terminal binding protein n=1 Tax=Canibacter zhoujuaniae TaxID=2708343 RepID=UPI001421A591|nr:C-terminal binding protein [Canibacter zhoujuaniae]